MSSQDISHADAVYIWHDSVVGNVNSPIYNGVRYVERHRMLTDRHKFFKDPDFKMGSVIYKGQPYFGLLLKYDIYDDRLLLKHADRPELPALVLDKSAVTHFSIGPDSFDRLSMNPDNHQDNGNYFQILYECRDLRLLKLHKKTIRSRDDGKIRYFEFKDRNRYFLRMDANYYEVEGFKQLSNLFEDPYEKRILRAELNRQKKLKSADLDAHYVSGLNHICENSAEGKTDK